jgi:hypothetical protein
MAKLPHSLYILDKDGNPANSIPMDIGNGTLVAQPISGKVAGWKALSYVPSGAAIDTVPQYSVQVPLSDWRNVAIGQGTVLMVMDDSLAAEVTRGTVIDIEDAVDEHGTHWATVTFADALYDLSRADVTSSFAADIGYTNRGAGDPIPTRAAETLSGVQTRLLSLADTPWTPINDVTGFDGLAFAATGSIIQAYDKLRQARFAHFRREFFAGSPRYLRFFNGGTPFAPNGLPVWAVKPGPNPTAAANVNRLQMIKPTFSRKTEVVNSLTPTGAGGAGTQQLTLRILYNRVGETALANGSFQSGPTTFQGYDPAHPIFRRPTQSGATSDGNDYFIEDAASIALYGRTRQPLPVPDVGITVAPDGRTEPVDETAAAVALYTVALNKLVYLAKPRIEIAFTTPAIGDIRNCGGQTVHVKYDGWAFDEQRQVFQFLGLDADYWVLSVVRAVADDATAMDTWTVSSSGQALASAGGTLLGVMDSVTAMHAAVQAYPMSKPRPKSQNIGPGADLTIEIFADNSMVRRHWALMYLTLEGMVHTRADNGHTQDVTTAPMNSDVNAIGHDVNALPIQFAIGGVAVNSPLVYDPNTKLHLASGSAPGGAVALMTDGTFIWAAGHPAHDIDLSAESLSIIETARTTDAGGNPVSGTGGKVKKTTGAADIAAGNPSPGTVGGSVPKNTHAVSAGYGAAKAFATTEEVYRGPSPTGVTVLVDGVQRFGPFNSTPGALDLTPFVSDQNAHTVTVKSATNGAADVFIDVRDDVTTFATRPTG